MSVTKKPSFYYGCLLVCILLIVGIIARMMSSTASAAPAGDWPQWRYDAGRGASTPAELPQQLHLMWVRHLPEPRPAWPASQPWLRFDLSYSPVAAGTMLFVPSMVSDSLTAYDTETGEEQWRFYTDGPVRFAPIAHRGMVYFGSDDGYLYCVDAANGKLLWRFRGGPSDRRLLGNERLISTWPIRGGPVLLDGTIYFTAGIWPFMGVFVHAIDAETGKVVWTNSGAGSEYTVQPHSSPAFAGLVPRGHLTATEAGLIVPGGRTQPGCYDLKTGRFRYFSFGDKGEGSYHVTARGSCFFTAKAVVRIADGKALDGDPPAVHEEDVLYSVASQHLVARKSQLEKEVVEKTDRKGNQTRTERETLKELWKLPLGDAPEQLFLKAGRRLFVGEENRVAAIEPDTRNEKAKVTWEGAFEGKPWTMLAADEKLFVVTVEGRIYCFGARSGEPKKFPEDPAVADADDPADGETSKLDRVLAGSQATAGGYCVMFRLAGPLADASLAETLVGMPQFRTIVIDSNVERIDAFRRRMDDAGLYGHRVAAHVGLPLNVALPPYFASVAVCNGRPISPQQAVPLIRAVFRTLRPYGGTAWLPMDAQEVRRLAEEAQLQSARVEPLDAGESLLVRAGALPGAADWTHQYGDAGNSVVSKDQVVKLPLGLLWFGNGPPNDEVLPRHGHGPSPQVAAGRSFIEGADMLRAVDIYTGRLLWQKQLPGLGRFHDSTQHQPGAAEVGSNYVSLEDSVYVVYGSAILQLDAATGELKNEFTLSADPDSPDPHWGSIAAWKDQLIVTSTPVELEEKSDSDTAAASASTKRRTLWDQLIPVPYAAASRRLVALNRHTGKELWHRDAKYGFRHNNIAIGADKVFCIDGMSQVKLETLKRRGVGLSDYRPRLLALDVRTGKEIWSTDRDVFGTFLNYSAEYDSLVQAGSAARDRAFDESASGMIVYRGRDGSVVWRDLSLRLSGPPMLHQDTIISQGVTFPDSGKSPKTYTHTITGRSRPLPGNASSSGGPAVSLLTGEPKMRTHPLTGEPLQWKYTRNYGCNTAVASEHLLTFRSAAAGFYDLLSDGGTGNFGGFKSGCTSNLIVAGGLLNAPEYTRTCTCRYQNQTSLALVHDPTVEVWTFNAFPWDGKPVRRVGINFGAPGDRMAEGGTLWLDYPGRGGPSPDIPVKVDGKHAAYFRYHSSRIPADPDGTELSWVAASGVQGARAVTLTLASDTKKTRKYIVRLHFAEVKSLKSGGRVFDVALQDHVVLPAFDVVQRAGGVNRAVVEEFPGIEVAEKLKVSLTQRGEKKQPPPVLCGVEVVAEGW